MPKHLTTNDAGEFVQTTQVGVANGVPPLDSGGKIPSTFLPASASGVTSVNALTGDVVITPNSIGAIPNSSRNAPGGVAPLDGANRLPVGNLPTAAVQVVNGYSGPSVTLSASDFGAISQATADGRYMRQDSLVFNAKEHGAVINGTTDDAGAINSILSTSPAGSVVVLPPGDVAILSPIIVPPGKTLMGLHSNLMKVTGLYDPVVRIKPLAGFTGAAAVMFVDQATGGYGSISGEQRLIDIMIHGASAPANVDGIQSKGNVQNVVMSGVTVRDMTGNGIYTGVNGGAYPYSWRMHRVMLDNNHGHGMSVSLMTDLTMIDCQAIGNFADGFVLSNIANSQISSCRAEWNGNHGWYITGSWGTGTGSGGMQMSNCGTDRNGFHGVFVDATGNAPIVISNLMTRRDGRNGGTGGGGYAGLCASGATVPLTIGDWTNYPGVDDNSTGTNSPQYGGSFTGNTFVQIENAYLHANTAGLYNGGGNTTLQLGTNITYASGTTAAPTRAVQQLYARTDQLAYNVKDHGVVGDGTTNDTTAIQAIIDACSSAGGGAVFFPEGTYKITTALTARSNVALIGAGDGATIINQTSTTANALTGSDLQRVTIRDLCLSGPGSGSGIGVNFDLVSNGATLYITMQNVTVKLFGGDGVKIKIPIVSSFDRVVADTCGGWGFNFYGITTGGGSPGTSCSLRACYANGCTTGGYRLYKLAYVALEGCAADNMPVGYLIEQGWCCALYSPGTEGNTIGVEVNGGYGNSVYNSFVYNNKGIGIWVTGTAHLTGLYQVVDVTPNGTATKFIKVDAGSFATITGQSNVTSNDFSGTVTVLDDGGNGIVVPGYAYFSGQMEINNTLSLDGHKITSVANGTTSGDAVNYDQLSSRGVSATDYGATGNGTTDDTAAIQSAVNALSSTGGTVYLPAGSYLLNGSSGISIATGAITLRGAGAEATKILIGSGFSGTSAITVTAANAQVLDLSVSGNSSTTTSNPAAHGITVSGARRLKVDSCQFWFLNGYALRALATSSSSTTNPHGTQFTRIRVNQCAGGIHFLGNTTQGYAVNSMITDIHIQQGGVATGANANLDGVRIEDAWDVLAENVLTWLQAGTGSALHIIGNCAASFIKNLDALGPNSLAPNVLIEDGANGSVQNVQISGGVIQQGTTGLKISGASQHVHVNTIRVINNSGHGATVDGTGSGIHLNDVFFSQSGQGATGTNYDLNWSGTATGIVNNCYFASPIVSTGVAGVQQSINVTAGQAVAVLNANFAGTSSSSSNWVTAAPAVFSEVGTGFMDWRTTVKFGNGTRPAAFQPSASTNTALAVNVNGNDANDRMRILGDGTTQIGPGTAGRDTTTGRAASGTWYTDKNLLVGASAALGDNGVGEIQLANATTVPTTNPTGGVLVYSQSGVLKWRAPGGTVYDLSTQYVPVTANADNQFAPGDHGLIAWSAAAAVVNDIGQPSSGAIRLIKITLKRAATISNIWLTITVAGATLTASQNFVGLYTSAGTRVALSADQSSNWTSTGVKSIALTASYSAAAGDYFVAILSNGTTIPTFSASSSGTNPSNVNLTGATLRFANGPSSQTTLPSSITMSSNTAAAAAYWVGVS